jgi:hypothetical protein
MSVTWSIATPAKYLLTSLVGPMPMNTPPGWDVVSCKRTEGVPTAAAMLDSFWMLAGGDTNAWVGLAT